MGKKCVFCDLANGKVEFPGFFWENKKYMTFLSGRPNTEGFSVVITKEHYPSYAFDLPDDIGGLPDGHFAVLSGYDRETKMIQVADPWKENGIRPVNKNRVISSILLGILTHDANLVVIEPK